MGNYLKMDKLRGVITPYQYFMRKYQGSENRPLKFLYKILCRVFGKLYHCDIHEYTKIGYGLYLGHPYCITINGAAQIGCNCNLHKGVTIGQENRGIRKGSPVIGNCVWIGINATIVGHVTIGDDVLIAPNTYVNCDIPSHSIVFGNPCQIKYKENATEGYINRIVKM